MKIPVTGDPTIDAATVRAAIAAQEAKDKVDSQVAALKRQVGQVVSWARRKHAILSRKIKQVAHDIKERTT